MDTEQIREWEIPIVGDKRAGIYASRRGDGYVMHYLGTADQLMELASSMWAIATGKPPTGGIPPENQSLASGGDWTFHPTSPKRTLDLMERVAKLEEQVQWLKRHKNQTEWLETHTHDLSVSGVSVTGKPKAR